MLEHIFEMFISLPEITKVQSVWYFISNLQIFIEFRIFYCWHYFSISPSVLPLHAAQIYAKILLKHVSIFPLTVQERKTRLLVLFHLYFRFQ